MGNELHTINTYPLAPRMKLEKNTDTPSLLAWPWLSK